MSDEREADIATLTIDYLQAEIREVALDVLTDYSPEDPPSDADIAYAQRQADAIASRWAMHRDATFADETLRVPASSEPRPENPYRTVHARMSPPGAAWDEGFAAGRAAFDAVVAERDALEAELDGAPCACHCWAEYGTPCGDCPAAPSPPDTDERPKASDYGHAESNAAAASPSLHGREPQDGSSGPPTAGPHGQDEASKSSPRTQEVDDGRA